MKKVTSILDNLTNGEHNDQDEKTKEREASEETVRQRDIKTALSVYNDVKVPDKMMKDVPFAVLNYALEKSGL